MIVSHGASDVGRKRQRNEDSFTVNDRIGLYLVADGMGGHNAGDVASATAAKTIDSFMIQTYEKREITWPFGLDPELSFDGNRLRTALKLANQRIWQLADSHQEYTGMGTTVVAVNIADDLATIGSVGDSRLYLVRGDEVKVITHDDVWLNETWVRRAFTPDQLEKIPLKNVLSKAVGSKEDVDVPILEVTLQDGDLLLLCSDGLHGLIDQEALGAALAAAKSQDVPSTCKRLIEMANEAGGRDNITVVALKYTKK